MSNFNNGLVYIEVDKIYPHPNNPRKDVGDVTELADSIKACGVMQNLTVVPKEGDTYTVIIGHRRLAASKIAGLEKVPCVVSKMGEKEQISTMLLENMQRSDLTIYEQAQGFQMMMDFGESVETIAEKTGFSQSTVRRRVKLLNLNSEKFRAAEQRGGTLEDYLKVAEIKNEKERNRVTDAIGTSEFNWRYRDAMEKQVLKETMPLVKKEMKAIGAEKDDTLRYWSDAWEQVKRVKLKDFQEGCIASKVKSGGTYRWSVINDTAVCLFKKKPKEKKAPVKKSNKEIKVIETNNQLKAVTERAYECRKEFLTNFSACNKYTDVLNEWMRELILRRISGISYSTSWKLLCEKIEEKYEKYKYSCDREKLDVYMQNHPENAMAVILDAYSNDSDELKYYNAGYYETMPTYCENKRLDLIYEYLCKLGYEMSSEEIALQNGTHELFGKKASKK